MSGSGLCHQPGRRSIVEEPLPESAHGVLGRGRLLLLTGRPVEVEVTLVMAAEPVYRRDYQGRAARVSGEVECRCHGLVDLVHVGTVAGEAGNPEWLAPAPKFTGRRILPAH